VLICGAIVAAGIVGPQAAAYAAGMVGLTVTAMKQLSSTQVSLTVPPGVVSANGPAGPSAWG
jgi:hypothetical protein